MNDYNINRLEDGIEKLEYDISIIILANLYALENGESVISNVYWLKLIFVVLSWLFIFKSACREHLLVVQ